MKENKKIRVVELFAGVGGFRLGLEKADKAFEVVWSNQWEPATKAQHASQVYVARFGEENHSNEDIANVPVENVPDHDLLVGGFPCQDYSVATTLKNSKGLIGKKGVLWWSIHRILEEKGQKRPRYLLLENVDRLLKSPSKQRGRDFAVILSSLSALGYAVEWRVINAADYGMPQRRRRVFLLCYRNNTKMYERLIAKGGEQVLLNDGVLAKAFTNKVKDGESIDFLEIGSDLVKITEDFNKGDKLSPFKDSGVMVNNQIVTYKSTSIYKGKISTLGEVLQNGEVTPEFFIDEKEKGKWSYLKGAKKEKRKTKDGYVYNYSEGSMVFPDNLNAPSRTIITGEGGKSPSRFKHVVMSDRGLRRLTPVELERLNMFPDNHTKLDGISDAKRAFFMGNALVVGVIEKIATEFINKIK